jgi:hypothetical protein
MGQTLVLTLDRTLAMTKCREFNRNHPHNDDDRVFDACIMAWADGEHNYVYVDQESGDLFQYDDNDHEIPVAADDWSFATHPPEAS